MENIDRQNTRSIDRSLYAGAFVFILALSSVSNPAFADGVGYSDGDPSGLTPEEDRAQTIVGGLTYDRRNRSVDSSDRQFVTGTALIGYILSGTWLGQREGELESQ